MNRCHFCKERVSPEYCTKLFCAITAEGDAEQVDWQNPKYLCHSCDDKMLLTERVRIPRK